jgi:catechol 2,3-dioxygenase-like lactoylglutathione lyase family enzyme
MVSGTAEMHFHHVHFNTVDPEADMAFFEKFFDAKTETFCNDAAGLPATRATKTDRAWFLYTKVATPPDDRLNAYMEHIGWLNQMPEPEYQRQRELGIMFDEEGRAQCPEAASGMSSCALPGLGTPYYYYTEVPNGTRVEVALGPGPATSGFGHVHFVGGEDLTFFSKVSDGKNDAAMNNAIDGVNHINSLLDESILDGEMIMDSRDKPLGHLAYSTTDLEAAKTRIMSMGIEIAEDISMKAEYGFRSFFVRAPKGSWLEIVEDSRFQP